LAILTKKQPSAETNPAIHCGYGISIVLIKGLSIFKLLILGKTALNFSSCKWPKFIAIFFLIIASGPVRVRCS
jgi:hypothetical protein